MTDGRDTDLLSVGKQCSHPLCHLVDFLPFNCQHCKRSFCQEHFKVEAHSCKDYDETKFNRVAPDCPLCNQPIAVRPGEDPNIRMDRHLETQCYVITGKSQKTSPRCAHESCPKILFSPIRCDNCNHQFCPTHRFPDDHNCTPRFARAAHPAAGPSRASNLLAKFDVTAKKLMQTASTPTATKRLPSTESTPATNLTPATPAASSSKPKAMLPFSKTDRLSSVPASSTPDVTSTTSIPTMTNNNSSIDTAPSVPNLNTSSNKRPLSPFIPRPLFASA